MIGIEMPSPIGMAMDERAHRFAAEQIEVSGSPCEDPFVLAYTTCPSEARCFLNSRHIFLFNLAAPDSADRCVIFGAGDPLATLRWLGITLSS